jgi:hypothetical protein
MLAVCALAGTLLPSAARAYDDGPGAPALEAGLFDDNAGDDAAPSGPVRMARFSVVEGEVTWRPDADAQWSEADVNLPIRQGAQVSVGGHGRAEIQFDDGSVIRLGTGAVLTLQTLYSDADGEFTELKLTGGLASLRLKNDIDIYQVDTPFLSAKTTGPARVRFGVSDTEEIAVKRGSVKIDGPRGAMTLHSGEFLEMPDANASYDVASLPGDDSWEEWNNARDRYLDGDMPVKHYAPPNVAIASPDLDEYGDWRDVPSYGVVWCPRVAADWRPYCVGHWVWCDPFGWTWVSSEPWGWAPYHYGSWFHCAYGWAWRPGPVHQYWCPAVVHFYDCNGSVCWVPLAPAEVYYPPVVACGFARGNWSMFFSIGACAVYYPHDEHFCHARPWGNGWVNRWDGHRRDGFDHAEFVRADGDRAPGFGFAANHNTFIAASAFRPANLQVAGASIASYQAFRGGGAIQAVPRSQVGQILSGRTVAAPPVGSMPTLGPAHLTPTQQSISPSRTFISAPSQATIASRPVFRTALSPTIAHATGQPNAVTTSRPPITTGFPTQVRTSVTPPVTGQSPGRVNTGTTTLPVQPRTGTVEPNTGRQLTPAEQAAIKARGDLGYTPRVRSNGDSTGVGQNGHAFTGTVNQPRTSGGTYTPGSGNTYRPSSGSQNGGSANPGYRHTYTPQGNYNPGRSTSGNGGRSSGSSNGGGKSSSGSSHSSSGDKDKKNGH